MFERPQRWLWAGAWVLSLLLPGQARSQALCTKKGAAAVADTDSVCAADPGRCTAADYAKAEKGAYSKALNQCVGKVTCDQQLCPGECVIVVRGARDRETSADPTCGTEGKERCHVHIGGVCGCACPHVFLTVSVPGPYQFRSLDVRRPFAGRIEQDPVATTVTAIALDLAGFGLPVVTLFAQDTDEGTRQEFVAVGSAKDRRVVLRGRQEGPGRITGVLELWADDDCGRPDKVAEHAVQAVAQPSIPDPPAPSLFQRGIDPLFSLEPGS